MYKLKSLVLAVIGLLCTMSVSAEDFEVDGIYYNITSESDKTVEVTYREGFFYDRYQGTVSIPESVTYNGSTYSVTSIGEDAFAGCSGLISVEIGNSVTSIGDFAFYGSGLTSVVIPNSVTSIGNDAFHNCEGLTSVEIGNSVTSIGAEAFLWCVGLTSVKIEDVAAWCNIYFGDSSANPLSYAKNLYLNGELVTDLVIPNEVSSIGNYAFYNCSGLTSVEIPNSVTSIGDKAFYNCSGLTSVVIGNSVTGIAYSAFFGCENLKTVLNRSDLTFTKGDSDRGYIAYYADVVINKYDGWLGDFIFAKDNDIYYLQAYVGPKTDLVLPENYKDSNYAIGASAFRGCLDLTSVEIPNSVISIGDDAFSKCI